MIAKFDFQPNEPEELAFRKGDVITVLEQVLGAALSAHHCPSDHFPSPSHLTVSLTILFFFFSMAC